MMQRHSVLRTYSLAEFAVEQRLLRREKLFNRLREEKLEALKLKVSKFAPKFWSVLMFKKNLKVLKHKLTYCFLSSPAD